MIELELRLLQPSVRAQPTEVDRLLHEDFAEVGASGRRWDRAAIIAALASEPVSPVEVGELHARAVADGAVIVTYVASRPAGGASSFRFSLWVRTPDGWRMLYHQGTPVSDAHP